MIICFNRSQEIPPEAVEVDNVVDSFFSTTSDRKDNDVVSSVAVDYVGMDFHVKFCVFETKTALEIFDGLISCRTNERT